MTMKLTDKQLEEAKRSQSLVELLEKFPCHTEAVELVTEASTSVCGQKKRDGLCARLLSQKNMSKFDTKSDYHVNL